MNRLVGHTDYLDQDSQQPNPAGTSANGIFQVTGRLLPQMDLSTRDDQQPNPQWNLAQGWIDLRNHNTQPMDGGLDGG